MNDRGLVEVPENAVRSESLAFGLSAPQLGILGAAVGLGAVANLLPLWVPLKAVVILVGVAPVALVAVLPIRGEPAYRWLIWAVRFLRGRRTWRAVLEAPDKSQLSGAPDNVAGREQEAVHGRNRMRWGTWPAPDNADLTLRGVPQTGTDPTVPVATRGTPAGRESRPMEEQATRLRIIGPEEDGHRGPGLSDGDGEAQERPLAIPHVLPGPRLVCVASFAGGVGKTTLAVEIATLVGARARVRTIDGDEQPVRVLVLDASRTASAIGLRLGLEPAALSEAWGHRIWREPGAVSELAKPTRWQVDVVTLPPHPQLVERDGQAGDPGQPVFGVLEADAILEGAQTAGYHLIVADLGGVFEDGHRQLIDQADLVLGIVRPTIESLPDVFRLASVLRGQGMGRKLAMVASQADDDTEIGRIAHEVGVPLVGRVSPNPSYTSAADRGEPTWSLSPAVASDIAGVARAAWPLLGDQPSGARGRRLLLRTARGVLPAPGSGER
jgi:CO dehydrogenase nickel-insertion accessory protein CooC1